MNGFHTLKFSDISDGYRNLLGWVLEMTHNRTQEMPGSWGNRSQEIPVQVRRSKFIPQNPDKKELGSSLESWCWEARA